ncbi:MAG: HDIG domain-containing metalloprotein [Chloroflexota bacterium]
MGSRPEAAGVWRHWALLLVFSAFMAVALTLVLAFQFLPGQVTLKVGDVSRQNIKAPKRVSYTSQIKTNEARDQALASIAEVYEYDAALVQQQKASALAVCNSISLLRNDLSLSLDQKRDRLQKLPGLSLSSLSASEILFINEATWREVITDTARVLDEIMRDKIRPSQLAEAKSRVRSRLSGNLTWVQSALVDDLVRSFLRPTEYYNSQETERQRRFAANNVEPVRFNIEKDEVVVREGSVITPLDIERLEALGLRQPAVRWEGLVSTSLLVGTMVLVLAFYLLRFQPQLLEDPRHLLLMGLSLALVCLVAKVTIPGRSIWPYVLPFASFSMLIAILLNHQLATFLTAVVALIVGYVAGNSLALATFVFVSGLAGILSVWRLQHTVSFLWAGLFIAAANVGVIVAFWLPGQEYSLGTVLALSAAGLANGALSAALALGSFSVLGNLFGITTILQLLELAHPNQPLLRRLQLEAPGTYYHSIVVGNLAEQAAEAIGADTLLVRVASYYHDIGKVEHPYFFIENQVDGVNVHDQLDPKTSAQVVIAHVTEGLALARKHKLPKRIADLIPEHHGTRLATYFYGRAVGQLGEDKVDPEDFRYPGPRPRTKEAALIMLADGVEATVRSTPQHSPEKIDQLVREAINEKLAEGQLDECDLTLRDLDMVRQSFVGVLLGVYHPRIEYPALPKAATTSLAPGIKGLPEGQAKAGPS